MPPLPVFLTLETVSLGPVRDGVQLAHLASPGPACSVHRKEGFLALDRSDVESSAAAL